MAAPGSAAAGLIVSDIEAAHGELADRGIDATGIMVPTGRRVYVRNPDGTPVRDSVSITIDIANVTFS